MCGSDQHHHPLQRIGARCSSVVRAFAHGVMGRRIEPSWGGPIELVLVPGCGMYYPVCGMMHIKELLLLIGKCSLCGGSGLPLSLSEWCSTICVMPYNRHIKCVECVIKSNISFLPSSTDRFPINKR